PSVPTRRSSDLARETGGRADESRCRQAGTKDGSPPAPATPRGVRPVMAETGYASFSATVEKTNRILKEIEQAYGWPKERRKQSYAALRSVLHAVRDRLNVNEVAQLGAQLTMLVRGIYYDGWDPD